MCVLSQSGHTRHSGTVPRLADPNVFRLHLQHRYDRVCHSGHTCHSGKRYQKIARVHGPFTADRHQGSPWYDCVCHAPLGPHMPLGRSAPFKQVTSILGCTEVSTIGCAARAPYYYKSTRCRSLCLLSLQLIKHGFLCHSGQPCCSGTAPKKASASLFRARQLSTMVCATRATRATCALH